MCRFKTEPAVIQFLFVVDLSKVNVGRIKFDDGSFGGSKRGLGGLFRGSSCWFNKVSILARLPIGVRFDSLQIVSICLNSTIHVLQGRLIAENGDKENVCPLGPLSLTIEKASSRK